MIKPPVYDNTKEKGMLSETNFKIWLVKKEQAYHTVD